MESENTKDLAISLPGEWVLKKLLGPTLETLGEDFNKVYLSGRDKIIQVTERKVKDIEDGASANLRVAREVFWNGAFTDESICAEYFGGILAASRSQSGKDDSGVFYVDVIKSLSSAQLRLHYFIYGSLNKMLIQDKTRASLNVGQSSELHSASIYLASLELVRADLKPDRDLEVLCRTGLLSDYQYDNHKLKDDEVLPYTCVTPTTLGIQLYSVANNMLDDWREFPCKDFGDFESVKLPEYIAFSLEGLLKKAGILE